MAPDIENRLTDTELSDSERSAFIREYLRMRKAEGEAPEGQNAAPEKTPKEPEIAAKDKPESQLVKEGKLKACQVFLDPATHAKLRYISTLKHQTISKTITQALDQYWASEDMDL